MGSTAIPFATKTWNFMTGCSPVSEGCLNCWAEKLHTMRHKAYCDGKKLPVQYAKPFSEIQVFSDRLTEPLRWRQPQWVFPCATSDIALARDYYLDQAFAVMSLTPQHLYILITKRPDFLYLYLTEEGRAEQIWIQRDNLLARGARVHSSLNLQRWDPETAPVCWEPGPTYPLPNVIVMTAAENQARADERIPWVLKSPAALRGVIIEPMLGPVDVTNIKDADGDTFNVLDRCAYATATDGEYHDIPNGLDWVICGGESGPGARPCHPDWVRSLRDQCKAAGTAFNFKQWGEYEYVESGYGAGYDPHRVGKKAAGRLLDGELWDQYPEVQQ